MLSSVSNPSIRWMISWRESILARWRLKTWRKQAPWKDLALSRLITPAEKRRMERRAAFLIFDGSCWRRGLVFTTESSRARRDPGNRRDRSPLELAAGPITAAGALTTVEAAARLGSRVKVAGMRQTWRRSVTTRGDYIYFMAMEDLEGMLGRSDLRGCISQFSGSLFHARALHR